MTPWQQRDRRRAGPPNAPCWAIRSAWPTFSESSRGSAFPSTRCSASSVIASITRSPKAVSSCRRPRRLGSSARTAGWSLSPSCSVAGSPNRLLGMEHTVCYGGVVVMCGHIALAIAPGLAGAAAGLILVALGSGALKANASSSLGTLDEKGHARCDGGITLGRLDRAIDHRPVADSPRIPLRLRCGGSRHGTGPCPVRRVPAKPGCARPHYAKPIATRNFAYGVIGMGLKFLRFLPTSGTTGKAVPVLLVIGAVAVFAGVVVFAIAPWISRLMEGVHQVGALVGVPCTTTGSNQPARISCSIGGSMLPPDTITTVRPCGVERFR